VLRTNLQFVDVDTTEKVLIVTSSLAGEGKTTTAVNLAIAHAQAGQRVLLIEGDLRRPRASRALGLDQSVGVTTVLIGKVTLEEATQVHANGTLHVLSSGAIPPNPAELLQSNAMGDLIDRARSDYDVVIIDAPPLLPVTDAAILAAKADGAIIVVRHGRTRRDQVGTSASRLAQVDAAAIGFVINMTPGRRSGYGYGYGYGYGPDENAGPRGSRRKRRRRAKDAASPRP
jgi:receptor protein-tyrosine kinase